MLKELIAEGEQVRKDHGKTGHLGKVYIAGQDYERWIAKGILFMEKKYPNTTLTNRFLAAAQSAAGNDVKYHDTMIGILRALDEYPEESK